MQISQIKKRNKVNYKANNETYSTAQQFVKKMLGFSLATWVGAVLSFFVTPIITRAFTPSELGKINMFQTYYTLLMYISILGLNQGYIRYYNNPPGKSNKDTLFKLCTVLSTIFTLLVCILIFLMGNFFSEQIADTTGSFIPICLSLCLLTNTYLTMSNTAHRMEKNVFMYTIQAIAITVSGKVTYLVAVLWSPTYELAVLIMTISFTLLAIVFLFDKRRVMSQSLKNNIGKEEILPVLKFSLPLVPVLFMSYLNTSVPRLLLKKYVDFSAIGVYSTAVSIVSIITLLQTGFNIFWTPFVYENYKSNSNKIRKVHNLVTYTMVVFGLCILLGQDILYLLIGDNFRSSKSFFGLLLMSPIAYTIAETTGLGINISKKSYLNLITSSVTLATNVLLCITLIPKVGIVGAGVAVSVSSCVMLLIKTILGEKYFKTIVSYKKFFSAPTIFLAAAFGNYYLCDKFFIKYVFLMACIFIISIIYIKELKYLYGLIKLNINSLRNKKTIPKYAFKR